jgi:hypothetical protein
MPKSDLVQLSAPRVELDQRSREARLRLEHAERSLVVRPLPKQSLLRRVLRRLGLRIYAGEHLAGRSAKPTVTGGRPRPGRRMPGETGGAAGRPCASSTVSWPEFSRPARVSPTALGRFAIPAGHAPCTRLAILGTWPFRRRQYRAVTSWFAGAGGET